MRIIWSALSIIQFEEIETYLKQHYGRNAANEFSSKLLSTIKLLAKHPYMGKKLNYKIRAIVIVRQITVHYSISTHIKILTLWDNRQKPIY